MPSFSDEEIKHIQTCLIHQDFNLAAFYILNKSMLNSFKPEEKQGRIEKLGELLQETSPFWPDLEVDIVRVIAEKFLEE